MAQRALITGITGQDAAYLTKLLLEKGYEVYGAHRRSASMNIWRLHELGVHNDVKFVPLDLMEFSNIVRLVDKVKPNEVYNLAAQSFVGISFEEPIYTGDVDGIGVVRLLEAIRLVNPKIRFYQASTSEMFGKAQEVPQSETTPFHPRSPYGVAKLYGHWVTVNYREAYGMCASSGILFNHESPLRGLEFVTRKITAGLAHIRYGQQQILELGNMEASRDWGFAQDYVHGMWLMLQQPEGDDYILATGHTHSVRQFVERAAEVAGFRLVWHGEAEHLRAVDQDTERVIVRVSPEFYRPAEVEYLVGDSTKARTRLGWAPSVEFEQLVEIMTEADLRRAAEGTLIF
jgi:GDPmannose 4,6-dehydratase